MHRFYSIATLVAASVMIVAGCSPTSDQSVQAKESATVIPRVVIPVEAGLPIRGPISEYLETISRIEANVRVEVTAEGMGKCVRVFADIGDTVRQGQVLAQLDTTEMSAQLAQNEVQVRQQRAEYERAKQGYAFGGMPRAELDAARFAYEQGLATLRVQKLQYDNLTVKSPIDGLVVARLIEVGQLIGSGTPVFSMVDPSTFQLVVEPPERELSRLSVGQQALVTIDALPGRVFDARVQRIDPSADPISGTIRARLAFDEDDRPGLLEGLFSRVRLVMETIPDALLVPKDVVVEENGRYYVFVIDFQSPEEFVAEQIESFEREVLMEALDDEDASADVEFVEPIIEMPENPVTVAIRREVEIGLQDSRHFEIRGGLNEDDLIVVVGQSNLKSGAEVSITSAGDEVASTIGLTQEEALRRAREARGGNDGMTRRRLRDEL
jgi:membrane fusion protein (multidrug efflux system)